MQIVRLTSFGELLPWIGAWDALSQGVPFRRWEWLESWWRNYGHDSGRLRRHFELFVLAAIGQDQSLLGIAPWYLERTTSQGRLVRFLGSGETCSEYLSIMCRKGTEESVAIALADWLTAHAIDVRNPDRWDVLKLGPIETDDLPAGRLLHHLRTTRKCSLRSAQHELLAAGVAWRLGRVSGPAIEIASQAAPPDGPRLFS